ncbi:MAG: 16S rRNA (cytidine(1402)-2'-O)-methyltransferase, partial [Desulfobacterales bacterium]|nr:16S rRNA (cytidine(1402)-2'-O)-methyltransferase [Desulfobacterales bacterium]
VATPMGNLEDITFRAVRVLKEVDIIAAEDTRHSRKLLTHYGITTPMTACHEHNENQRAKELIERLTTGESIALISDAGTPLISDPGYRLVKQAGEKNIPVVPVPGCNAAITGLSASGLPTDAFLFCGFPPKKAGKLEKFLTKMESQSATLIFYESPKRIKALVSSSINALGDREACLARELTKRYEEFIRGSLSQILSSLEARDQVKGECVLFIQGKDSESSALSSNDLDALILDRLSENPKTGDLAKELSALSNLPKKQIYNKILELKKST